MKSPITRPEIGLLAGLVSGMLAASAPAEIITLSDQNSVVQIDPTSPTQAGMFDWRVDGVNYMAKQWFWYRIGPTDGEHSVDTLPLVGPPVVTGNTAITTYDLGQRVSLEIQYTLNGGLLGSGTADIAEVIRISNRGTSTVDLHFYQYADFDLSASDSVTFPNSVQVLQSGANGNMAETVALSPSHHEGALVGVHPDILDELNDQFPTTFDDTCTSSTGNVAWAFEWDKSLAPSKTFIISKDKQLNVPEPSTLALALLGLLALAGHAAWRRR